MRWKGEKVLKCLNGSKNTFENLLAFWGQVERVLAMRWKARGVWAIVRQWRGVWGNREAGAKQKYPNPKANFGRGCRNGSVPEAFLAPHQVLELDVNLPGNTMDSTHVVLINYVGVELGLLLVSIVGNMEPDVTHIDF